APGGDPPRPAVQGGPAQGPAARLRLGPAAAGLAARRVGAGGGGGGRALRRRGGQLGGPRQRARARPGDAARLPPPDQPRRRGRAGLMAAWAAWAVAVLPIESSPVMLANVRYPVEQAARQAPSLPLRCDAIREVFGNPFRPIVFAPAWRRRNDAAAPKLAE